MIPRADALAALERDSSTWSWSAAGSPARAWPSTPPRAATAWRSSSGGLRVGHVEPLLEADPRRAALPPELRPRARARGAARALAARRSSRRTWSSRCRSSCPSFEGKRPDRLLGMGLNMYDAMSWRRGRDEDEEWSPARHRTIDGARGARVLPSLAGREPTAAYLFYDCQTDDVRLVLTVLGEAERFGAVIANGCEVTGPRGARRPRRRRARARRGRRRRVRGDRPRTWSTPPACGPTGSAPTSSTARRRSRASGRAAART